jgi:uncharacterized membrane protein (DUF4010 family)
MIGPTLQAFIASLSMGALIGLIRQWADRHSTTAKDHLDQSAGMRTYALWSLLGALSVHISVTQQPGLFLLAFGLFGAFLITAFVVDQWRHGSLGLTSFSVALITFLNGALVMWGEGRIALAVCAALGLLIAAKPASHAFTEKLKSEDIRVSLQFLVVSGLILPMVPNHGFGPSDVINPYKIWWMVVLISGLGFAGYLGMRLLGTRAGVIVTGIAGGMASSTATTLALSRTSRQYPALSGSLSIGILLASTIMFARVWVIVFALLPVLAAELILPFCLMALPGVLMLLFSMLTSGKRTTIDMPEITNPLTLSVAVKFALLYGAVILLVSLSQRWSADQGTYVIAFLSGLTDMDAIALSMIDLVKLDRMQNLQASDCIVIAAIANTLFKAGFAMAIGSPKLRLSTGIGMGSMVIAGALAIWKF